jgi:hypothetical protein
VAKLVARLLATAALWARIQTSLKNTKIGRHKQRSWQLTLARQKIQKKCCLGIYVLFGLDIFSLKNEELKIFIYNERVIFGSSDRFHFFTKGTTLG